MRYLYIAIIYSNHPPSLPLGLPVEYEGINSMSFLPMLGLECCIFPQYPAHVGYTHLLRAGYLYNHDESV